MRMLLLIALLPVLAATLMPERENIFAAGMLNFSSFRATVLFSTRTHLIAITTGRHTGGDVSARNVVVRTSTKGGAFGTWTPPRIIATVSAPTLEANGGLYTGTGIYDPVTKEAQLYWGECLEKCHPGEGGQGSMAAPTFMLTVSTDNFESHWEHINQTASVAKAGRDPEAFLPFNWFDNAAVVYDAGSITVSTGTGAAVESKDRRARGWEEGGLVLVGSIHNFSNHSKNASYDKWAVCYHSSDHGRTLARGVDVHPDEASNISVNEPQLAKFANGTLLLVGHGDALYPGRNRLSMATSTDFGRTFSPPRNVPGLVQPGLGLGLLIHNDAIYISYANNGTTGEAAHDASRNNLTVATSTDQGHSFTTRSVDRRFTGLSAMALTPTSSGDEADGAEDGQMLGVLYEAGNKRFDGDGVWFARMPLSDSAKH